MVSVLAPNPKQWCLLFSALEQNLKQWREREREREEQSCSLNPNNGGWPVFRREERETESSKARNFFGVSNYFQLVLQVIEERGKCLIDG
jgi:hypothetical protein